MGCCRRRKPVANQTAECKNLEDAGSGLILWPFRTDSGLKITIRTETLGFVEAASYLQSFGCNGPTATTLRRYMDSIRAAINKTPEVFYPYAKTGIPLTQLIRLVDQRSSRNGRRQV